MRNGRERITLNHVKMELDKLMAEYEDYIEEEPIREVKASYTDFIERLNSLYVYISNSERMV